MKRLFSKVKKRPRLSGAIAIFLLLLGSWLIWGSLVNKRLGKLEQVAWFGEIETIEADIDSLKSKVYWILPPELQARRMGLIGDQLLHQDRGTKAFEYYFVEYVIQLGSKLLTPDILNLVDNPAEFLQSSSDHFTGDADVILPPKQRIDTSPLTSHITPLANEANAYFAFQKLEPLGEFIETSIGDMAQMSASDLRRRFDEQAEANRDNLSQWNDVVDSYHRMRRPLNAEYLKIHVFLQHNYYQFRIALADGQLHSATGHCMKIYETIALIEDDADVVSMLVAISTRNALIGSIPEQIKGTKFENRFTQILGMQQMDRTFVHRTAARDFLELFDSIKQGLEETASESGRIKGYQERYLVEAEASLFRHKLEMHNLFVGGDVDETVKLITAQAAIAERFKIGRRSFYWDLPHAGFSDYKEAQLLFAEELVACSAAIVGAIAQSNTGKINAVFSEVEEKEALWLASH